MKKHLFVLLTLSSMVGLSQIPAIKWQKSFGGAGIDKANAIRQTSDGGYIIAGETTSTGGDITGNNGNSDYWVAKIDTAGLLIWQKSLGGSADDRAYGVTQTADGGYLVVGTSNSPASGDITAPKGQYDVWIVKLTSTGTLSWQKSMGGTAVDEAYAVQQTADGGFIIAGDSRSNNYDLTVNNGLSDFWLIKTDGLGAIQWQKAFGGSVADIAYAVQQTADGGYVVAGSTDSNNGDVSGNNGSTDYWVIKLSAAGVLVWQKCLGGNGGDAATSVKQTTDGGYIVGGKTTSNNGNVSGNNGAENAWLVKLTSTGSITWQKCYGGNGFDGCNSVQQTSDGGYIFAAYASSNINDVSGNHGSYDYWVVKTAATGTLTWQKCFGGSSADYAVAVQQTSDNGYVIAGRSASTGGDITNAKGLDDYWVVRLMGVNTASTFENGLIENSQETLFNLFPNPNHGLITVTGKNQGVPAFKITLTDVLGRPVYESILTQGEFTLDVSATTTKGIYFLSILNAEGGTLEVKKIVME